MSKPMFTVVVCVRNGADHLADALDSLAAQTFDSFETIVVDDGSDDDSGDIARAHPISPTVLRTGGHGDAVARNRAIADAAGRYIVALDHDDLYHASRLERLATWLDAHPGTGAACTRLFPFINTGTADSLPPGASGWSQATVDRGSELEELVALDGVADVAGSAEAHVRTHEDLLMWFRGGAQLVVDRTLAITAGLYPTHAGMGADNLFLLNVSRLTDIVDIDQPTYFYRLRPGSLSRTHDVPWGRVASVVAFRMGGLHMDVDRALGKAGVLESDPQLVDLMAQSAFRGDLIAELPRFRHLLNLYAPNRDERLRLQRRLAREVVTGRFPVVESWRRRFRNRFPAPEL